MISEDDAATIAKDHGLGLEEAVHLRNLALDVEHANKLAAMFSRRNDPEELADAVTKRRGF